MRFVGDPIALLRLARRRPSPRRGGPLVYFRYLPGMKVASLGGTFARADAQTCATYIDATATVQTVAANVLRDGHVVGGVRSTLLEGVAATNLAFGACSFGDTTFWTNPGTETLAAATSCVSGQTATKHTLVDVGSPRIQNVGTFVNAQTDCVSVLIEQGTATISDLAIFDTSASATLAAVRLTWATMAVTTQIGVPAASGATLLAGTGPNGGKLALFWMTATGTAAGTGQAGHTRSLFLSICSNGSGSIGQTAFQHAAQFEANAAAPSSLIVTAGVALTRAADKLSFPYAPLPQAMTLFVTGVINNNIGPSNYPLLFLGTGSVTTAYMACRFQGSDMTLQGVYDPGSGANGSNPAGGAAYGKSFKARQTLSGTGVLTTALTLGAAAEVVGASAGAAALPATWSAATLTISGTQNFAQAANMAVQRIVIASRVQTIATMNTL